MGIGRREFLRLSALALAGVYINPALSVITRDDVYINRKLGILFHKPKNWGFIKVTNFGLLKDKQILGNGYEDYKDEVWEELGDPICIVTKYFQDTPENYGIFSPTITLNITPKIELEEFGYNSFEEVVSASLIGTSSILRDFQVVNDHKPIMLSGSNFYEYTATYLFEHVELPEPLLVELKSLKTEHSDFYYDFNFHHSPAQGQIAIEEYEEFKKTIQLI